MCSEQMYPPKPSHSLFSGFVGFSIGFVLGLSDYLLFSFLGIVMRVGGRDVTFFVCLYFAVTFGACTFLLARYRQARDHLRLQQSLLSEKNDALQASQAALKQQMEALFAAQHRADENEKLALIGQMAASVAHEVRNPLGVIQSSASLLMDDLHPQEERYRAGEFIREEVLRLNRFCTDLLQYARPTEAHPAWVHRDELRLHLEHFASRVPYKGRLDMQVEVDQAPLLFWLDQDLWLQSTYNLLQNALQFIPLDGHIKICFFLETSEEQEKQLCIKIQDNGSGVPAHLSETIFRPFFTTRSQGTGLGLAWARRLVEAHKGRLCAIQGQGLGPQGQGACFVMQLPQPFDPPVDIPVSLHNASKDQAYANPPCDP